MQAFSQYNIAYIESATCSAEDFNISFSQDRSPATCFSFAIYYPLSDPMEKCGLSEVRSHEI